MNTFDVIAYARQRIKTLSAEPEANLSTTGGIFIRAQIFELELLIEAAS